MHDLSPYAASADLLPSDARRAGRAVSRYRLAGQLRTAQIDTDTDVSLAKADCLTTATGQAMGQVVRVAQAQRQLETLAPEAAGRLAFLAEQHVLGLSEVVDDLRRQLRRR